MLDDENFEAVHPSLTGASQSDVAYKMNADSVALQDSLRDVLGIAEENGHHNNETMWSISPDSMTHVLYDSDA